MRKDSRTPDQVKGQNGACDTMKVKLKDGTDAVIDAHAFDPEIHDEPGAEKVKKEKAK